MGQAGRGDNNDLYSRLKQHRNDHLRNRWQRFSWFGLYSVGKNDTLVHANSNKTASAGKIGDVMDHLEGILISLLEPTLNRQGARWQSEVEEYIQWTDPLPGEQFNDIESKLEKIMAHLEDS